MKLKDKAVIITGGAGDIGGGMASAMVKKDKKHKRHMQQQKKPSVRFQKWRQTNGENMVLM